MYNLIPCVSPRLLFHLILTNNSPSLCENFRNEFFRKGLISLLVLKKETGNYTQPPVPVTTRKHIHNYLAITFLPFMMYIPF